jgi:hypothetical protein
MQPPKPGFSYACIISAAPGKNRIPVKSRILVENQRCFHYIPRRWTIFFVFSHINRTGNFYLATMKRFQKCLRLTVLAILSGSAALCQQMEIVPVDARLTTLPECYVKKIPVVVVSYLPYDGDYIDQGITGVHNMTVGAMQAKILDMTIQLKFALEEGSRFRGYKNDDAPPYAGYEIVQYIYVYENFKLGKEVGWKQGEGYYRPDYNDVMNTIDGQDLVEDLGVAEVWLWGWHYGPIEPAESNMSSPLTGDLSNSERYNDDLPVYNQTYVLYNYNYDRGVNEAIHNHGHQIEVMLDWANHLQDNNVTLFREKFVGWRNGSPPLGRCGDTHHPPNTTKDYDYYNLTLVESDIEDWRPAGGTKKPVNVNTWGNLDFDWPDNNLPPGHTEAQWYIYWMQNIPGNGNTIDYGSNFLTNWWRVIHDWDYIISNEIGLYSPSPAEYEQCQARAFVTRHTRGSWTDPSTWIGAVVPDPMKLEGTIKINGYITREGDLAFKAASDGADTLFVLDTLVVLGKIEFKQNNILKIGPDGVVIITGGMDMDKGLLVVNTGVLAIKGTIDTKNDSEILFMERLPESTASSLSGQPGENPGTDQMLDIVYTPRVFHVPTGESLLDAQYVTGGPFSPRGPIEDSVYMKAPDPYPDDPDSALVTAIWNFFLDGKFPLPVHLLYFDGVAIDGCTTLRWATAEETDNSHFVIERSEDALHYTTVGSVPGHGTSVLRQDYRWQDCEPAAGDRYYRLVQVDVDGTREIFGPVLLRNTSVYKLRWYPNPLAIQTVPLHIQGLVQHVAVDIEIRDLTGKSVWKSRQDPPRFGNTETFRPTIPLPSGIYMLRISQGGVHHTGRLIVQ